MLKKLKKKMFWEDLEFKQILPKSQLPRKDLDLTWNSKKKIICALQLWEGLVSKKKWEIRKSKGQQPKEELDYKQKSQHKKLLDKMPKEKQIFKLKYRREEHKN